MASGPTTVVVVNSGAPAYHVQAHPYAQASQAGPYAAPVAQVVAPASAGLPPGWSQQSDGSGAVWYVGPSGESQWEAPKA